MDLTRLQVKIDCIKGLDTGESFADILHEKKRAGRLYYGYTL